MGDQALLELAKTPPQSVKEMAGRKGIPLMIYPPEEKKGFLNGLLGDIFQRASLANLNLYPQPEYKMIYQIR